MTYVQNVSSFATHVRKQNMLNMFYRGILIIRSQIRIKIYKITQTDYFPDTQYIQNKTMNKTQTQ